MVDADPQRAKQFAGIPSEWHETIRVHNKETKRIKLYFRCKYEGCGSVFRKSCNLRDHFRKHTSARPFKCEVCSKFFTQSGNLGRHLKNVHGKARPTPAKTPFKSKVKAKVLVKSGDPAEPNDAQGHSYSD